MLRASRKGITFKLRKSMRTASPIIKAAAVKEGENLEVMENYISMLLKLLRE